MGTRKKPCTCRDCKLWSYVDDHGQEQQGRLLSAERVQRHKLREQHATSTAGLGVDHAEGSGLSPEATVLFATLAEKSGEQFEESVAVRPRDCDVDVSELDPPQDSEAQERGDPVEGITVDPVQEPIPQPKADPEQRMRELSEIQSLLALKEQRFRHPILKFISPPRRVTDPPSELDTKHAETAGFVHYRQHDLPGLHSRLITLLPIGHYDVDRRRERLIDDAETYMRQAVAVELRAWRDAMVKCHMDVRDGEPEIVSTDSLFSYQTALQPFITLALVMAVIMHTLASVSHPRTTFLLSGLKTMLYGAFVWCNAPRSTVDTAQRLLLKCIPRDVRTALRTLHLEPEIVKYACCPKCFALYPPDSDPSNADDLYPHHCSHVDADGNECGSSLVVEERQAPKRKNEPPRTVYRAICIFPYRPLASWLKVFLSRPEIEKFLEKSWEQTSPPGTLADIMDAPAIRQFRGPDGKTLFSVQRHGSMNLVFSLFVDWFNPYGNKKAGKSHSIGAIYMACLNLPIHVRYAPENIYLAAIIPGPREPDYEQLNRLLTPLVDDLLNVWTRGIYLTRTALRWMGRLVRVAMIPLVCDLPALRKTAGFMGHSSAHFCSFCPLLKRDISNLDRSTWPSPKSWEEHKAIAEQWRDGDSKMRDHLEKEHGLRWSELLRLPYWDPTRFAVVDVMHNLFLGELRHHCMEVWGIDVKDKPTSERKKVIPHTPEEQKTNLAKAMAALEKLSKKGLEKIRKGYIVSIARLNNVPPTGGQQTKAAYITALIAWVPQVGFNAVRRPPILDYETNDFHLAVDGPPDISKFQVLSYEVLQSIRADILSTYLPSWLERPPSNFGSPGHGKLKADQWRTVCTVSMVISLVRLWSCSSASDEEKELLDNFLHLVSAVDLASKRTMSSERAAAYDRHMYHYLAGLKDIFDHDFVPNHHLSLHLHSCLLLFGPVHGYWAFPFERYNGLMGQTNTNHKKADMPLTFMRYFYIGANVRRLMATTDWPNDAEYQEMLADFEAAFGDVIRGTRVVDMLPFLHGTKQSQGSKYDIKQEAPIPQTIYGGILHALTELYGEPWTSAYTLRTSTRNRPVLNPNGQKVSSIERDRISFASRDASRRNSFVIFKDGDTLRAGQISQIYLHSRGKDGKAVVEPFFVLDVYKTLSPSDAALDPYRRWPHINTCLYQNQFEDESRVLRFDDIVAHFAAYTYTPEDISTECIVVCNLDRHE